MTKRISAKIEEYQKDGETKGKYVEIGVILNNQNGDYILLNPEVSLSGVLAKQNALEFSKGGQMRSNIMCSVFEQSNQNQPQQNAPQQGGFQPQQNAPQQHQGGFQQQNQGGFKPQG